MCTERKDKRKEAGSIRKLSGEVLFCGCFWSRVLFGVKWGDLTVESSHGPEWCVAASTAASSLSPVLVGWMTWLCRLSVLQVHLSLSSDDILSHACFPKLCFPFDSLFYFPTNIMYLLKKLCGYATASLSVFLKGNPVCHTRATPSL